MWFSNEMTLKYLSVIRPPKNENAQKKIVSEIDYGVRWHRGRPRRSGTSWRLLIQRICLHLGLLITENGEMATCKSSNGGGLLENPKPLKLQQRTTFCKGASCDAANV
jgi:hypothetical protein